MKISRIKRLIAVPVLVSWWCRSSVAAAEMAAAKSTQTPVGASDLLNLGSGMTIVIGAILLCGWVYARTRGLKRHAGDVFNIVGSHALGPKERILLVEIANKQLVIGMTAHEVRTLHVFDQPVIKNDKPSSETTFVDRLRSAVGAIRG